MGSAYQIASGGIYRKFSPRKRIILANTYVSRFAVIAAIFTAAKELGYRELKGKQYQAVSEFVYGKTSS